MSGRAFAIQLVVIVAVTVVVNVPIILVKRKVQADLTVARQRRQKAEEALVMASELRSELERLRPIADEVTKAAPTSDEYPMFFAYLDELTGQFSLTKTVKVAEVKAVPQTAAPSTGTEPEGTPQTPGSTGVALTLELAGKASQIKSFLDQFEAGSFPVTISRYDFDSPDGFEQAGKATVDFTLLTVDKP